MRKVTIILALLSSSQAVDGGQGALISGKKCDGTLL